KKIHAEVDEVLADRDGIGPDDLRKLTYTQQVIKETLRLHHPNWLLMRRTIADTKLGDFAIPAGRQIIFSPTALHRDPDLYPDPMRFNPDRWETASREEAFIPFVTGRHKCIGEQFALTEMAVVIATVAAQWRLVPVSGHPAREVVRVTVQPDA